MTGDERSNGAGGTPGDGRAERLGRRLRENLRRRKAQARARREAVDERPGAGARRDDGPSGQDK